MDERVRIFSLLRDRRKRNQIHTTILKVFISYAQQMHNLSMNEDWLDVTL